MERKLYFYSALLLTIVITIGSLISIPKLEVTQVQISDKLVHISAYCLLTLNWLLAYKFKANKLKFSLLILLFVFIYGIVIEVLQGTITNYRQADLLDVLANFIGIGLSFIFFSLFFKRK
ncbi:VanZ family protein [Lutibacter profundi]|uniref:VanZ family protein n=1 Tax=Lutibacter profundi TaxID=1622118 RepID=UPI0009E98D62|nr:VanZ family protein [Lutibacter profundi]